MVTQRRRRTVQARAISDQWLQYIRGTVTLSAANTFTQITVALPVIVGQGMVIEAHLIEFALPPAQLADFGETDDQATFNAQLAKSSQTAIITLDNPDLIYGITDEYSTWNARTAEQAPVLHRLRRGGLNWQFPEPILLPFENIYFGCNTSGVAAAPDFQFRLGYKTVRLSPRQLPEMIQAIT